MSEKTSYWPLWTTVTAAIGAVLAYSWWFQGQPDGPPEAWGQFGDFVGGMVNPVVGIITVLLVLQTLAVTRTEAEQTRRELKAQTLHLERSERLTDQHRRLEGMLRVWDNYVNSAYPPPEMLRELGINLRLGELFDDWGYFVKSLGLLTAVPAQRDCAKRDLMRAKHYLLEMAEYCEQYDVLASESRLGDFYRRRMMNAATFLETAGLLSSKEAKKLAPKQALGAES